MSRLFGAIRPDSLHEGVDQAVPREYRRLDGDVPTEAQIAVAEVTGLRDSPVRTSRPIFRRAVSGRSSCSRSVIAELVSVTQSTVPSKYSLHDRRRVENPNVGVVINRDLVDIGQLLEFVLARASVRDRHGPGESLRPLRQREPRASARASER